MGRSDSRVSRIPHLGKLYLTETLFLIWFCRCSKLLIGITIWALPVGTQSAIIQGLVFRSPYSLFSLSDLNGLNPVESLSVSYGEIRRGALMKWTTCWVGGDRCHPWALFYTWRSPWRSLRMVLCWSEGGTMWLEDSHSLTFLIQSVLVSVIQCSALASLCILGYPQWCVVHG